MTMTPERLAKLDSVMAKATPNEWAAKMWDSPYKIGIWAKDGADYKTCTPIATGRAKAPDKRLLDELHLIAYEREQVPIVEANIAAIVALHNAYPDLRAHIDAQAATIAALQAFKDYVHERLDAAGIPTHPDGKHSATGCRVGDRLDIALDAQAATIARLREAAKRIADHPNFYITACECGEPECATTQFIAAIAEAEGAQ